MLIGFVVASFYYFLMYDSGITQQTNIATGTTRIQELQAQMADMQQKLDAAAVYKKTAAEIGSTITKLLSLIPEDFKMTDLKRLVSNEAKVAGSSLSDITVRTTETSTVSPEFEELSVTVDMQGSFLQHMVFLSNLTKINQILIVRRFDFAHVKEGKGDESPTVKFTADIIAFRYKGNPTPTTPTAPSVPPGGGTGP
jgi:Tfp pilus assembly protein PilO